MEQMRRQAQNHCSRQRLDAGNSEFHAITNTEYIRIDFQYDRRGIRNVQANIGLDIDFLHIQLDEAIPGDLVINTGLIGHAQAAVLNAVMLAWQSRAKPIKKGRGHPSLNLLA